MIFTASNTEDIRRYYLETYVKFPREYGDTLFFIQAVYDNRVVGRAANGDELVLWLDDDHPYEVDFLLPRKSFFQHNTHALLLYRIPAKQYQRGICSNNTAVVRPTGNGKHEAYPINFEILSSYVSKQKFFTLEEAIASGFASCVLSSRMMYDRKTSSIYIDTLKVADVINDKRVVRVAKPIFREEISLMLKEGINPYNLLAK